MVVPHVGAHAGRHPGRYPPQPGQAHDVVGAQPAGAAGGRSDQVGQRPALLGREPAGMPRRQRPVLAALVELVRRGADADAGDDHVLAGPGVGAAGVRAHGEVADHADGQARQSGPWTSAIAHHAAQSSTASRSRARKAPNSARRPASSGTARMISSAARLAAHTASRSISAAVLLAARSGAPSASTLARSAGPSAATSGMSSMRRYSGLMWRRVIARYGDGLTGGTGSAACSGFTSTKS